MTVRIDLDALEQQYAICAATHYCDEFGQAAWEIVEALPTLVRAVRAALKQVDGEDAIGEGRRVNDDLRAALAPFRKDGQ